MKAALVRNSRVFAIAFAFCTLAMTAAAQGDDAAPKEAKMPATAERLAKAIAMAKEARAHAHAPYSSFEMGAAVGTDKGILVPGTLVENVSLGLAMCAERVALFSSVALDAGRPNLLVLVSPRTDGELTFPCGACLQVALELGGPDLHVEACDLGGECQGTRLGDLAPRLPRKKP